MRILHLEDDPADAELVSEILAGSGFAVEIVHVESREGFLAAIQQAPPAVILSDYNLPSFDGASALRLAGETCPEVPFLFVSGTIGEDRAVEVLRSGATDYVLKTRLDKLPLALRRALEGVEARRRTREAERLLQSSEERFRLVLRATNDTLYDWNIRTETVWWNENMGGMFKYPPAEIGHSFAWWEQRIHPEDHDLLISSVQEAIDRRAPNWTGEYRFLRGDGTYADVLDRGSILYEDVGRPLRWVGSMMDVSEFRSLRQQFLQAQKMEAVGRLAGGVAHDFNNLLTVINGYSELLLARMAPGDPSRGDLEEIHRAGGRAASLTRQLLAVSRKQVLLATTFDLNALVGGCKNMLDRLVGEDVRIIFRPAAGPLLIHADPGQIEQVLLNLVVNARDAMPQGGKITLETAEADPWTLSDTRPDSWIRLSVADAGTGMSDEVKAHLYEPFFTTKERGKGTGLGLSTVFGIVKSSGGTIDVESAPGRGTTFRIRLPRAGTAALPGRRVLSPRDARGTETILIAEDQETVRRLAQVVLEGAGYRVLSAVDGTEALRLAESHEGPIHLLLTDLVMRSMSGTELARILKRQHPETRVLLMSGYPERGLPAGEEAAFLQKPFTLDGLKAKVRDVLDAVMKGKV